MITREELEQDPWPSYPVPKTQIVMLLDRLAIQEAALKQIVKESDEFPFRNSEERLGYQACARIARNALEQGGLT